MTALFNFEAIDLLIYSDIGCWKKKKKGYVVTFFIIYKKT